METHAAWFEKKKKESLEAGRELWLRRTEFFPHLILCGVVERQLSTNYGVGSKHFSQLIDRLKKLNNFAAQWTTGGFSDKTLREYGLNVSGEGRQTMQKYGGQRRFRFPGGSKAFFEKHIKTGDLRFHFLADEKTHRVYVGYIGPHLDTVTG
ncbi:MAG: hypothetical protein GY757_28660 [bacterium]|nr:hypothetical protein [bacterium]